MPTRPLCRSPHPATDSLRGLDPRSLRESDPLLDPGDVVPQRLVAGDDLGRVAAHDVGLRSAAPVLVVLRVEAADGEEIPLRGRSGQRALGAGETAGVGNCGMRIGETYKCFGQANKHAVPLRDDARTIRRTFA